MNIKKVISTTLLAGIMATALTGCSPNSQNTSTAKGGDGKEEKIKLSYAFFAPEATFPGVQMKKFEEEVEKRTNGRVDIELYPGGTLLQADNMYQGVRDGVVDIGLSSPTYETGKYPLMEISDLPSTIANSKVASEVAYSLVNEYDHAGLDGLEVVTAFAGEPAFIQTVKKVKGMSDLKGLQLRISGANQNVLKALGASPVGMSQSEAPEALQTGIIKGNVSSREVLKDFQLAEHEKFVVDYPLSTTTFMAVMKSDKFNSLPEDIQKVIKEVGAEMPAFTGEYLDNYVGEVMEWSKKEQGVEVVQLSETEKDQWDKKFEELRNEKIKEIGKKGLDAEAYAERYQELIREKTTN